jgi:zinc/manganese transport system substrate-binding protein
MNKYLLKWVIFCLAIFTQPVHAALNIMACEPEWASLAEELGGDLIKVTSATTALQDPHRIEARPSLIARARNADLVVCTGAELEIGWLPLLLQQSGNAKIQPGAPGYFEAARYVTLLEIPASLDRAQGDVHASGNPHIQTDPRNIAHVAAALSARLAELDPAHAADYQKRAADFSARWGNAIARWEQQATILKGVGVVVQHKSWTYLTRWLGLVEVAALEPKPGVEPSSTHLAGVLAKLQQQPARMVLRAAYNDGRPSEWLAERARIPAVVLPFTVGGNERSQDLFSLFDDTVQRLLEAAR